MSIERADKNIEKQRIREQARLYEQAGLDIEAVENLVNDTIALREKNYEDNKTPRMVAPEESIPIMEKGLYVHPSDPLRLMGRELLNSPELSLKEKKVLTVAGSGETVPFFAMMGASRVDVFDISPFSCMMAEAKTAALKNLRSRQDYSHLFLIGNPEVLERKIEEYYRTHDEEEEWPEAWVDMRFFRDGKIYAALRNHLTPQTKQWLDMVKKPEMPRLLFSYDHSLTPYDVNHFRHYAQDVYLEDIFPALADDQEFSLLQQKLQKIPTAIFLSDIQDLSEKQLKAYDYLFLGNIGFRFEKQIKLIVSLLDKGVTRIGLCLGAAEDYMEKSATKSINFDGEIVPPENESVFKKKTSPLLKAHLGPTQELVPGTTIQIMGIKFRIICHDISSPNLPIYAEVHAEDNEDVFYKPPDTVKTRAYKKNDKK